MKNHIIGINIMLLLILGGFDSCRTPGKNSSPASHKVVINAMQFQPSELRVNRGDTVIFENRDLVVHDVTEEKTKAWKSSPLASGQSFPLVITVSADYYCSIHPVMKGKIIVN